MRRLYFIPLLLLLTILPGLIGCGSEAAAPPTDDQTFMKDASDQFDKAKPHNPNDI